jgi:hypothetical protein
MFAELGEFLNDKPFTIQILQHVALPEERSSTVREIIYSMQNLPMINSDTCVAECIHPGQPRLEISHNLIISQDSFTLGHMNHHHCGMNVWRGTKSMNGENRLLLTDELVEFVIQSGLYKCYPYYNRYNFIFVKKFLLPYKNTIGKTSEYLMC